MVNEKIHWAWLHLSDIHFCHGSKQYQADQKILISQIVEDIHKLVESGVPKPQVILLTGDVAFSGGLEHEGQEYSDAVGLISDLRATLKNQLPVFAVSGNHDVQRTPEIKLNNKANKPNNAARLLRALRDPKSGEVLDDVIANTADRALLAERFENYNEFCKKIGSPVDEDADGLWLARVDIGGKLKVQLIGLNTALLCNDDADERKLNLPSAASAAAFLETEKCDLVFALTHHPVDWLHATGVQHLAPLMRRKVHVHFHGHMHDPESELITYGTGERLLIVKAGAVHADESERKTGTPHHYRLGAIVELADGSIAARLWPRQWSAKRKVWFSDNEQLPESSPYEQHVLRPPVGATSTPLPADPVRRFAQTAVNELGRRRTAFPTDMSVEQLHAAGLVIKTRFGRRGAGDPSELLSVSDVIADYSEKSLLILGAPGAGKTVILYEISKGLLDRTERFPIVVDIAKFKDSEIQLSDVVQTAGIDPSISEQKVKSSGVFIIDGIDEALSAGVTATAISAHLKSLAKMGQIIVSCRENDYDSGLSGYVPTDIFDYIWYVQDWEFEQFKEFVARLDERRLLVDESLIKRIEADDNLGALVGRPLLARMLTFLGDTSELPSDQTSLYEEYIRRLGSATDVRIRAVGCNDTPSAVDLWQNLSWFIFDSQLRPDLINQATLREFVEHEGASADCTRRALASILDIRDPFSEYFHYSFYEFLAARYISLELQRNLESDPVSSAALLRRDLSHELRHHLVSLLRHSGVDLTHWPRYLAKAYQDVEKEPLPDRLIVRNLVTYLASRLDVPADVALLGLLNQEEDPFLRNSLFWALAQGDNWNTTRKYLYELKSDKQLASYNRGYSLYYYGDLPASKGPPHCDNEPYTTWFRTREALNEYFSANAYASMAPARKAIDMYSFCDIANVRDEPLTNLEVEGFQRLLSSLATKGIHDDVLEVLRNQLER
jgi:predicted MPP superfamily phosphohydrolase